MGIPRDSRKISGHSYNYRAHREVIFAVAQLSCLFLSSPTAKMAEPILTHDSSFEAVSRKEVPFGVSMTKNNVWAQNPQKRKVLGWE